MARLIILGLVDMYGTVSTGFVEKNHILGNRKSIILTASKKGEEYYTKKSEGFYKSIFEAFFRELESFSDEQLAQIVKAINVLDAGIPGRNDQQKLIKIE